MNRFDWIIFTSAARAPIEINEAKPVGVTAKIS